jgi:SAM-dependent methyltransferase
VISAFLAAKEIITPRPAQQSEKLAQARLGVLQTALADALKRVATRYDAHAWLDAYPMSLLDTQGFAALLPNLPSTATLLDIGAGPGDVHLELARLFHRALATETSRGAARRAQKRGVNCLVLDLAEAPWPSEERFDVVALLNVLDRTSRPQTLLKKALERLAPEGRLLLATPLPLRPHVEARGETVDPDEPIEIAGDDFNTALPSLVGFLEGHGLVIERWSRVPYVSAGDARSAEATFEDVVLVGRMG